MTKIHFALLYLIIAVNTSCGSQETSIEKNQVVASSKEMTEASTLYYKCAISNGMKGDSLFFEVSPDRTTLSKLYFKGYWRCSGKLTQESAAGPKGAFAIKNNKVDGIISEPPGGGSTSWRFELHAEINGKNATGDFRMNINNLGCDSYVLKFKGEAK